MIRQLLIECTKLIDSCAEVVITSGNATPCAVMNADNAVSAIVGQLFPAGTARR